MQTFNDVEIFEIKKLILALEELDDCVIETVRDIVLDPSFPFTVPKTVKDDLDGLVASRNAHERSNYAIDDMLEYLDQTKKLKSTWASVMRSLYSGYSKVGNIKPYKWKLHIRAIHGAGEKAWRAAIPASRTYSHKSPDISLQLIGKFTVFDDFIDSVNSDVKVVEHRERFSAELEDALLALVELSRNGPYAPITMEDISTVKRTIRQRRATERRLVSELQATKAPPVEPSTVTSPVVVPVQVDEESNAWGTSLILIVSIFMFTLLAAIFGSVAWEHSSPNPGPRTMRISGFLIQGCTMSILGLTTIIAPLLASKTLQRQAKIATWIVVVISSGCIVISIPAYLYLPTQYSATLAFFGSSIQSITILLMMYNKRAA